MNIPSISVGQSSHRNKFDISANTHTTSEVGYCQPMYSKLLYPNSTIKVSMESIVRLSSLFVPTMGRIELRAYHCFVPLNTLWTQWDAFQTGTDYTLADGTSYKPMKCPMFNMPKFFQTYLSTYDDSWNCNCLYKTPLNGVRHLAKVSEMFDSNDVPTSELSSMLQGSWSYSSNGFGWNFSQKRNGFILENDKKGVKFGQNDYVYVYNDGTTIKVSSVVLGIEMSGEPTSVNGFANDLFPITAFICDAKSCDFKFEVVRSGVASSTYDICTCLGPQLKRLRKVFVGLGYQFNPFLNEDFNLFKLLAYYKAWYQMFYPQRESNFYATNCYRLIKWTSEHEINLYTNLMTGETKAPFFNFFLDLRDMRYILPLDYFSLADPKAETRGATNGNYGVDTMRIPVMHGSVNVDNYQATENAVADNNTDGTQFGTRTPAISSYENGEPTALAIRTVMKLMRFINKNTVVGKKVSDLMRMRFGVVDTHEASHEAVYVIGRNSVNVSISEVMSNADTSASGGLALGDYAGKAIGYGKSKSFTFSTGSNHGIFLTFGMIVPKVGYYQGVCRDNLLGDGDRFDFFSPEYDALGYDDVKSTELNGSMQWNAKVFPNISNPLDGSLGYVPRYTFAKVQNDVCNGDISLGSKVDSMLPYALVRTFDGIPNMSPENFRSLVLTDFNRIFNSKSTWDDHFIIQSYFDVSLWSNMKSIATSFDTFDEDGDTRASDFEHQ